MTTLTTTSVADPDHQLIGIGILVETLCRLRIAFVAVREAERRGPAAT